ncbi:MAG TPA: mechanosensitive ion channel domain-containing protein, partial [Longimicrobiaceae bacterium]
MIQRVRLALALVVGLLPAQSLPAQSPGVAVDSAQDSLAAPLPPVQGAPVVLGSDTVLWVRARVGSFPAEERAAAIARRLRDLARDPDFRFDSVQVVSGGAETDVLVGDRPIVAVTDADAAAEGIPRDSLAHLHALAIDRVLREQGFVARARIIVVGVLFALLAAGVTVVVFRLLNRLFPRLYAAVERGGESWLPTIRLQKLEILTATQLAASLLAVLKILRMVVLAGLLYVSVPVILSFFPWTRSYADELFGYILAPFAVIWKGLLGYLPSVFALGAIALTTYYLLRLIRAVFVGIARGTISFSGFYPDWAIPTYKLVRTLVLIFATIASWPYLPGSDSAAFQGVGLFVGLLVSIGSATAVGNVVGGVVLTYMRPFRVGDRVRIADTEGDVVEKTLLITRVRTPKNVDITVPNSMVLASHIVNYSASAKSHGLILHTSVTIGYDVPW